jgi:putative copper export protein
MTTMTYEMPATAIAKRIALAKKAFAASDDEHEIMAIRHIAHLLTEIAWLGGQVVWQTEAPQPQGDTPS